MKKPTQKEIKKEIEKLKDLAPNIRQHDIFGGDNRTKIEAQIYVLENSLDEDDIYDRYDHCGTDEEVLESAMIAREWLDGDYDEETLSEDWEALRQK